MSSKKTCYLHIGAPKTGSTALQSFLFENRQRLADHGWVYPEVSLRGFGHHDLAFLISGGYPEWAIPQERSLDELTDDLIRLAAENPKLVMSSENFYLFPNPEKVADIFMQGRIPTQYNKSGGVHSPSG